MPRIQHKRGTSANLASVNPTPLAGELVWDSTENAIKIGDGATAWTSLAYVTATPRSHTHTMANISDISVEPAGSPPRTWDVALTFNYATSSWVAKGIGNVGIGSQPLGGWPSGSVGASLAGKVDTSDSRLTDARTPTAHKSSHATGGSDALTPADIGAAPAASPTFTGVITVSATSGSAGSYLPSLTFSGDANTGFGQVSGQSDTASVFTAGHERVRVDASGRVGIGRTPSVSGTSLEVAGDVYQAIGKSITFYTSSYGIGTPNSNGLQIFSGDAVRIGGRASGVFTEYARVVCSGATVGNVGIGTTSPSALLDINSDTIRVRTAKTPASASDTGNAGDICWDANYVYICVSSNSWKRASLASW